MERMQQFGAVTVTLLANAVEIAVMGDRYIQRYETPGDAMCAWIAECAKECALCERLADIVIEFVDGVVD